MRYNGRVEPPTGETNKDKYIMKNNIIVRTVLLSVFAAAVTLLSFRSPVSADSIVGYGCIAMLLGLASLEYGISWKWLFGR